MQIFKSSEKLTQIPPKREKRNWPWNKLECGQSFSIPLVEIKPETLRPLCSLKGRELNKRFKMVVHNDVYEVGRVK